MNERLSKRIREYSTSAGAVGCDILMVPHGDICITWAAEAAALEARIEALERLHTDVRALVDSWGGIRETTLEDCVVADLAILAAEEKKI